MYAFTRTGYEDAVQRRIVILVRILALRSLRGKREGERTASASSEVVVC